ncbi:uncharacterized protein [Palaemon carinicauda]
MDEEEKRYREHMQQFALEQAANRCSLVLSRQKYEAIVKHLLHPRVKVDSQFKHWVKQKKFSLAYVTNDSDPILTIPNHESRNLVDAKTRLQVVHAEQIFDIVYDIHTKELNHAGYKKVLEYVQRYYYGITRGFLQEFTRTCPWCAQLRPTTIISTKQFHNSKDDVMAIVKVISKHENSERDDDEEEVITHHIDSGPNPYRKETGITIMEEEMSSGDNTTLLHKVPRPFNHLNNDIDEKHVNTAPQFYENYRMLHLDSDDVDVAFVNYLIKELKSIKNPNVKKRLKKKIIDTVLEIQVEEDL